MPDPLLAVDDDFEPEPWDDDPIADKDEWVFRKADRLVGLLPRAQGKDQRTEGEVFDRQTLMVLHRFLSHGVLRSLDFPISTGKEANVFRGTTPQGGLVAVKMYRVNTATFKHVLQYIQGDERFVGVGGDKRSLVHAWCQKEYRNLLRMREAGCRVPEPVRHLQNVLVTEFLGTEAGAWPKLREVGRLENPQGAFDAIWQDYLLAYQEAELIHADLSEFNILVEGTDQAEGAWRPRIIDVGQAVLRNHPMATEYLQRDIHNLCTWARRQGLRPDAAALERELRA